MTAFTPHSSSSPRSARPPHSTPSAGARSAADVPSVSAIAAQTQRPSNDPTDFAPARPGARLTAFIIDFFLVLVICSALWIWRPSLILVVIMSLQLSIVGALILSITGRSPGLFITKTALLAQDSTRAPGLGKGLAYGLLYYLMALTLIGLVLSALLCREGRGWMERITGTRSIDLTTPLERSTAPHQAGRTSSHAPEQHRPLPQHPSFSAAPSGFAAVAASRGFQMSKPVPAAPQGRAGVVSRQEDTARGQSGGSHGWGPAAPGWGAATQSQSGAAQASTTTAPDQTTAAQGWGTVPQSRGAATQSQSGSARELPGTAPSRAAATLGPLSAAHHPAPPTYPISANPSQASTSSTPASSTTDAPIPTQHPAPPHTSPSTHSQPVPTQKPQIWAVLDSGGQELIDSVLVLGRAPSSDDPKARLVTVSDSTRSLSRTHLRLGPNHSGVWVEDAFSANGTKARTPDGSVTELPRGQKRSVPIGTILIMGERTLTITAHSEKD